VLRVGRAALSVEQGSGRMPFVLPESPNFERLVPGPRPPVGLHGPKARRAAGRSNPRLPVILSPWAADLHAALDQMPRRVRAELLRALRLQPEAFDEETDAGSLIHAPRGGRRRCGSFGMSPWRD